MRDIEYRQFLNEHLRKFGADAFHYWGHIGGGFISPMGKNIAGDSEQYTGLKDSNGVKIFEGDIVYISGVGNMKVVMRFCCWHFENESHLIQFNECEDIENIAGNIHENPELLEAVK